MFLRDKCTLLKSLEIDKQMAHMSKLFKQIKIWNVAYIKSH